MDGTVEIIIITMAMLLILFLIFLISWLWVVVSRQQKNLKRVAGILGPKGFVAGHIYKTVFKDRTFHFTFGGRSKKFPFELSIFTECPAPGAFRIIRERKVDRLFKRLRVSVEIQTGDDLFDDTCFILTESPGFTKAYLKSSAKRRSILRLLQTGFTEIKLDGDKLSAEWRPLNLKAELTPAMLEQITGWMTELTDQIPSHFAESTVPGLHNWKWKRKAVFSLASVVLVAGIVTAIWSSAFCWPMDPRRLFFDSLNFSLPALLVLMVLAVMLLKGRSSSHVELGIVAGMALIGFILAGLGGEATINGELDKAPIATHTVKIVHKYKWTTKGSTNYTVVMESWRIPGGTEEVRCNRSVWEAVQPGVTRIACDTRPGKLGFEWLLGCNILLE